MDLKEISQYAVTSGAELIVDGGYCVACAVLHKSGYTSIELSPVFNNPQAAESYKEYLSQLLLKQRKANVLNLGVFELKSISEIKS